MENTPSERNILPSGRAARGQIGKQVSQSVNRNSSQSSDWVNGQSADESAHATPHPKASPAPTDISHSLSDGRRPNPVMSGTGHLLFQVTTARGAIPVERAQVIIRNFLQEGSAGTGTGNGDTCAILYSGPNGKTDVIDLPAPARSLSLESASPGQPLPYALYNAEVSMDGFLVQQYTRIPIFDGITSVQQADLIPLPENGTPDGFTPDDIRFTEGQSPNL